MKQGSMEQAKDSAVVLRMNGVSKIIKGRAIVDKLSFDIRKGEIVGLLGPNGAGKTTTIRMMTGLIRMSEGDVIVQGHSIKNDFKNAVEHIGAIIENPEFYPYMTGLDNLKQYLRMTDNIAEGRIAEVVKLVGLQEAMNKKVKAYSLGMRQRLGIAQALLNRPKLLILDEPTNGLDPAGIREMRDYMRTIAEVEGISILISSHMLTEIEQICHRAVVIQNGKLVTVTTIGEEQEATSQVKLAIRVDSVEAAISIVEGVEIAQLINMDSTRSELTVSLHDSKVPELVAAFSSGGVGIYRITENKQSLEEDFLKWTGGISLRSFNNLILNEWLKISKKRTFFVPYLLLVLLSLLLTYIIHSVSPESFSSVYDFTAEMLLSQGIGQFVTILAIIGTAGIVSKEYSQGTIKFLLIRARSRTTILASKYVVVLLYALTLTLIGAIAVYGSGAIWFGLSGGDAGFSEILTSLVYNLVSTVVYVTLAFMIGILTNSTGVTIGIAMFATMIDKVIISGDFYKYVLFPNLNLAAYEGGGAPMPGMTLTFSIVMLALYTCVFLFIGFSVFKRRDVA